MPAAPPDPREAFGRLTATHLERLLGSATTLTRLVKPAASAKSMVTGLFSYSDGTTAAVVQIDLHLSLLMSGLMLGCPTPPAAKVEMVGHLERDIRDALAEALNVIAALFNQSQPRRTKLTGIMLAQGTLDTEEAGTYRIDFSMSIARAGNGRIALTGPAVEASAMTAAKLEDLSQSGGPEGLMQVCATLISGFVAKEVAIEAGPPLQIEAGLRAGVRDFIEELAGDLMGKLVDEVSAMRRAVDNRDPHLLQKTAHTLKGAASYLALEGLRARAEHIELCGRAGRLVDLQEIDTLMAAAQTNLAALKARI